MIRLESLDSHNQVFANMFSLSAFAHESRVPVLLS
jgi:hypothetical protein